MSTGAAAGMAPSIDHPWSTPRRQEWALWTVVGLGILAAVVAGARGMQPAFVVTAVVVPLVFVAAQGTLLAWPTMLGAILLVILFIPIRRYTIGGGGPVALEPYRVLIALVLACWAAALAVDDDVTWRALPLGAPITLLWASIFLGLGINASGVSQVSGYVVKALTFFGSYFLVMSFIASVLKPGRELDRMVRILVGGGTIVAVFALYEWRTGHNYFNELGRIVPLLHYEDQGAAFLRGTGVRALASAQHPIALGAVLVMLIPLAIYLYQRTQRIGWLACGGVLTLASFATGSRTAAVMLIVLFVCFMSWKRAQTIRMLPYLLVMVMCIQVVMPGTLGSFRAILQPSYLLKEQSQDKGSGTGRLADVGPSLAEWSYKPVLGEGFGTRITDPSAGVLGGSQILDDQWLGSLLELGAVGVFALAWLFARTVRMASRAARTDQTPRGWLLTALASSITAYAIGMFTFDAFAFIQVTFIAFIFIGFVAVALRHGPESRDALAGA